jgi:hypothetical protein
MIAGNNENRRRQYRRNGINGKPAPAVKDRAAAMT